MASAASPELNALIARDDDRLRSALVEVVTSSRATSSEDYLSEIEAIAARYCLDPDDLIAALDQPDQLRQVQTHVQTLRQRGDLLRGQTLPVIEQLIATAHRMAAEDMVAPAILPRLLDTLYKLTGLAEERGARLRTELAAQTPTLHLNILTGDAPAPPAAHSGELSLTIIAPDWTGGPKRVVSEQGADDR
jgi:hypothetical protein